MGVNMVGGGGSGGVLERRNGYTKGDFFCCQFLKQRTVLNTSVGRAGANVLYNRLIY